MTRNIHEMGQSVHFGTLLSSRIFTEAITNFDAGTPIEEILNYINDRIGGLEAEEHSVAGFTMNAEYFQPTFTIDAVRFQADLAGSFSMNARMPVPPVTFSDIEVNARIMPGFQINAIIHRPGPGSIIHQDYFTNQTLDSWNGPDAIGFPYTYTNDTHQAASDKFEITLDVTDPDFPDYRGIYLEQDQTYYHHQIGDFGFYNKRNKWQTIFSRPTLQESMAIRMEYNGTDGYVQMLRAGAGALGPDRLRLFVKGVQRGDIHGDSGGVFNTWRVPNPVWIETEHFNDHHRARWWWGTDDPPDWDNPPNSYSVMEWFEDGYTTTQSQSGIKWDGHGGGIITYHPNGAPWTHYLKEWTVQSLDAGSFTVNAFIEPTFRMDAIIIRGGSPKMDAFIQPYFSMNAEIIKRHVADFTMDATIPLTTAGSWTMDAWIEGWFSMDAFFTAPVINSFPLDATFVNTYEYGPLTDAVVRDTDRTYSFTNDGIRKVWDQPGTYVLDAWKESPTEQSFSMDAEKTWGFRMDAIFFENLADSFTIDAWKWPVDVELFTVNAVKELVDADVGAVTLDAQIKYIGERHEHPHWDDFDRPAKTPGWQTPSHSGAYNYSDGTAGKYVPAPTAGGVSYGHWNVNTGTRVIYGRDGLDTDREMSLDFRIEAGAGIQIGEIYFYVNDSVRVRKYHGSGGNCYLQVYYNAAWNQLTNNDVGGDWDWKSLKVQIVGQRIRYKAWDRSGTEPFWLYDDIPPWTPVTGQPRISHQGQSWFGSGGNPWDQRFDNWFVKGIGYPYSFNTNAVVKRLDQPGTIKTEALLTPTPFTMDAFIQPWFTMNARIWTGSGFEMDAIIEKPQIWGKPDITYDHLNSGSGSWTHVPPANAQALVVSSSSSGACTFGNKPMTYLNGSGKGYDHYIEAKDWFDRDDDVIREAGSSSVSWSTFLVSESLMEYVSDTTGVSPDTVTMDDTMFKATSRAVIWWVSRGKQNPFSGVSPYAEQDGTAAFLSSAYSTNPVTGWSFGSGIGIDGPDLTSITAGLTPDTGTTIHGHLFQGITPGMVMSAYLSKAFTMDAFISRTITVETIQAKAVIKREQTGSPTMDAAIFDFGEQLRDTTLDSRIILPAAPFTQATQFGWSYPGKWMWADVPYERTTLGFGAFAIIFGTPTGSYTVDAYVETLATDDNFEAVPGETPYGELVLGSSDYTEIPTYEGLWHQQHPGEARTEPMNIWLYQRYG